MLLMIFFIDMSVCIGISVLVLLIQIIKMMFGKFVGVLVGISVFFIMLCFLVGNVVGFGLVLLMLFGGLVLLWMLLCFIGVVFILLMCNVYCVVECVLLVLVVVMVVGFVISVFMVQFDWVQGMLGLMFILLLGSEILIIVLVGINFLINVVFFISYVICVCKIKFSEYCDVMIIDIIFGIVVLGIMIVLVIMVVVVVLGYIGQWVEMLVQFVNVFMLLVGEIGVKIFIIGFFGVVFLLMLVNVMVGGMLLLDGLGWGGNFDCLCIKVFVGFVLVFGLVIVVFVFGLCVQLIIFVQVMMVLVVLFFGVLLIVIVNKLMMGKLCNIWWQNVMGGIGFLVILVLSGLLIVLLIGMVV